MKQRVKSVAALLVLLITASIGAFTIAQPVSAAPLPGMYYQIKLYGYDRCLDVTDVSQADGALLQTFSCLQNQPNQVFYVVSDDGPGNRYRIIPQHSYKCLDVKDVSPYWGASIQQWTCLGWGQTNQIFFKNPVFFTNGHEVVLWTTFVSWCIAAQNWSSGAAVRQEDCSNTLRNYWELIPTSVHA
jgi:hypothetical protein